MESERDVDELLSPENNGASSMDKAEREVVSFKLTSLFLLSTYINQVMVHSLITPGDPSCYSCTNSYLRLFSLKNCASKYRLVAVS